MGLEDAPFPLTPALSLGEREQSRAALAVTEHVTLAVR
jgi:hypothetical protein